MISCMFFKSGQGRQTERIKEIKRLSRECSDLFKKNSRKTDKNIKNRMRQVLREKEELMKFLSDSRYEPVKQTIVEQSLKLVKAYLNLIYNYYIRSTENSENKIKQIEQRINYNNRKLGALKNYEAVLELLKSIEMDEKLVQIMREDIRELERISVRLNFIESTINSFKHRIISADSLDPEVDEIESIINETIALENVLNERQKARV